MTYESDLREYLGFMGAEVVDLLPVGTSPWDGAVATVAVVRVHNDPKHCDVVTVVDHRNGSGGALRGIDTSIVPEGESLTKTAAMRLARSTRDFARDIYPEPYPGTRVRASKGDARECTAYYIYTVDHGVQNGQVYEDMADTPCDADAILEERWGWCKGYQDTVTISVHEYFGDPDAVWIDERDVGKLVRRRAGRNAPPNLPSFNDRKPGPRRSASRKPKVPYSGKPTCSASTGTKGRR